MRFATAFLAGFVAAALFLDGFRLALITPEGITALSGVGLLVAAIYGLSTWKHELRARTNQEVALRLLRAAYLVRRRIEAFRSPLMLASEQPAPSREDAVEMSDDEQRHYSYAAGLGNRWNRVVDQAAEREVAIFDATAVFGEQVRRLTDPLEKQEKELFVAMLEHLDDRRSRSNSRTNEEERERIARQHRIIFGVGDDEFSQEYDAAIAALEKYLRPYLRS